MDFKNRSDKRTFEVHSTEPDAKNFPYTLIAHEDDVKADWLGEIQKHLTDHCKYISDLHIKSIKYRLLGVGVLRVFNFFQ